MTIRRSALARRITLRVDPAAGVVMVLPARAVLAEAHRFLLAHRVWVAERVARLPARVALTPGAVLPLAGQLHTIHHDPKARRGVWAEDGILHVSGQPEHVSRRVSDFLREEARRVITPQAHSLAARLQRKPGRVTIRDTSSRWGSCSSSGDLSFSWRLVLAPDWVLTYVVAHEVAHLVEMNHSPAFWSLVEGLVAQAKTARAWLKRHGPELHRYGEPA